MDSFRKRSFSAEPEKINFLPPFFSTLKLVLISSAEKNKDCHSKDLIVSNFRDVFTLKNWSLRSLLGDSKAQFD